MFGNKFKKNPKYFTITVYAVSGFILCALFVKILFSFSQVWNAVRVVLGVLSPFVIGTIIAYLINPLFKFLDFTFFEKWLHMKNRRKLRKTLSLLIAYIIVFGLIGALVYIIVPQFVASIKSLIETIGAFSKNVDQWVVDIKEQFSDLNLDFFAERISVIAKSLPDKILEWAEGLLSGVVSTSVEVVSSIIKFILSIFVSIYLLADKMNLEKNLRNLYYAYFKKEKAGTISRVTRECSNIFSNFFTGKIFDSLIIGILTGVLMLILRLPYPLLISVLVGATNVIPYFGPFIGAIPSIFIMLMTGWKEALIFTILIIVIQQIDGNLIGPKILGDSTGLSPIWVIFAITIGGWVGGVGGMLFGVPVMAVIGHIAESIINNRLERKGLHSMVKREEAPKTLNYSDMIRNIFKKKQKHTEVMHEEPERDVFMEVPEPLQNKPKKEAPEQDEETKE